MIADQPWTGYGFGAFKSHLTGSFFESTYVPPHAHNFWINSAFETGIVGATVLTASLLLTIRRWKERDFLAAMLALFALGCGLVSDTVGSAVNSIWILVAFVVVAPHVRPVTIGSVAPKGLGAPPR